MTVREKTMWSKKMAAAGAVSVAAFGLSACGTSGTETGADVEDVQEGEVVETTDPAADEPAEDAVADPYVGVYDQAFYDEATTYAGEEVTLTADVNEVVSPTSFTIAGTDDTTVSPLLVVHGQDMASPEPGEAVEVTGTVQEAFDLPTVEEEMEEDLDDDLFADYDGQPYIEATSVNSTAPEE